MKIKPILFSVPMVQGILSGRKTQTRRILKIPTDCTFKTLATTRRLWDSTKEVNPNPLKTEAVFTTPSGEEVRVKAKYQPGDILCVRETYTVLEPEHCEGMANRFYYKASHNSRNEDWRLECIEDGYSYKWKPSIFMPKAACRIFLQVANVRVEKLQDLSEGDAIAEGVELNPRNLYINYSDKHNEYRTAKLSFSSLWESINGKQSWKANPWVWVYDFKRVDKPANF